MAVTTFPPVNGGMKILNNESLQTNKQPKTTSVVEQQDTLPLNTQETPSHD